MRWLSKRIKSQASVKSIPGAPTKSMIHVVKGYLQDTSQLHTVILHNRMDDLKCRSTPEQIVNISLAIAWQNLLKVVKIV